MERPRQSNIVPAHKKRGIILAKGPGRNHGTGRLVAGAIWRKTRQRIRTMPAYRWRFSGRTPERVLAVPFDLRVADPAIAQEIYYGLFQFSGVSVETGGSSPFEIEGTTPEWLKSLHGFRWLRHLRAASTDLSTANAKALVADWLKQSGSRIRGPAWEPETIAMRIIAWLQHAPLLLNRGDADFDRAVLKSLALQTRYLRIVTERMPAAQARLRARIALAMAILALPHAPAARRSVAQKLDEELALQILPDGGHYSRNPHDIPDVLSDLLPLRQLYRLLSTEPPAQLQGSIDRMIPAIRFFRHRDGSMARFNGMGATLHERIAAILRQDDTGASPVLHAPHSGYDRLDLGETTVIIDTGAPPPSIVSTHAHAGCLSLEMSSARQCFIVNCGVDTYGPVELRPLARATAAHSTATLHETSQARFVHSPTVQRIVGAPLTGGPVNVDCRRIDHDGTQGVLASHDAYVGRFGIVHERELRLHENGRLLDGIDRFHSPSSARKAGAQQATVRFHIHPDITPEQGSNGDIFLTGNSGECWIFVSPDQRATLEESLFFASSSGPRRSWQIVIIADLPQMPAIRWRFLRESAVPGV